MFAAKLDLLSPVIQSKQKYLLSFCLYIHYRTSEGKMELDFSTENDICIPCDDLDTSDTSVLESNSSLRVSNSDTRKHPVALGEELQGVAYRMQRKGSDLHDEI